MRFEELYLPGKIACAIFSVMKPNKIKTSEKPIYLFPS